MTKKKKKTENRNDKYTQITHFEKVFIIYNFSFCHFENKLFGLNDFYGGLSGRTTFFYSIRL